MPSISSSQLAIDLSNPQALNQHYMTQVNRSESQDMKQDIKPSDDTLMVEIEKLRQEISRLNQDIHDLQISLSTTTEHGDLIEAQLYKTNLKLQEEVGVRQRAEATLNALFEILSKERDDLEIIVQTIVEHGDVVDNQWYQKLREATRLANFDSLTQIANRLKFDGHLTKQWKQMMREHSSLSILLCDIDYFKQYNDTYGHVMGDDCLKKVAWALNETLSRPTDLCARYGGEEFAAVLPQTGEAGAVRAAERMQAAIAHLKIPHASSSINPYITVSIGMASMVPQPQRSPAGLVDEADQFLYRAKQQGRNRIVYRGNA